MLDHPCGFSPGDGGEAMALGTLYAAGAGRDSQAGVEGRGKVEGAGSGGCGSVRYPACSLYWAFKNLYFGLDFREWLRPYLPRGHGQEECR